MASRYQQPHKHNAVSVGAGYTTHTLHTPTLLSITPNDLTDIFPSIDPQEARRILSIIHRTGCLPNHAPAGVRRDSFAIIAREIPLRKLKIVQRIPSSIDPFVKYAFQTDDNRIVESVRIPLEKPGRFVVCVSSQTGCAMGCAFCATARLGAGRNLDTWEIVDQIVQIRHELPSPGRIHGVVFQGMGEPLANARAVIQTIRVLTDSSLQSIDGRAITVSTAGMLNPLNLILDTLPKTRVGISIGHADPARRRVLMPIEASNPIASVLDAAADHAKVSRIATMLSYTLLGGVNDSDDDADCFMSLLSRYVKRADMAPRVSLIAYNSIGTSDPFVASSPERADMFRKRLGSMSIPVVRRYSGGSDVAAACGQLGMSLAKANSPS
ncbi:MAG: radical SAM protein [Polyangiaceae bacterium]|nr:radical SAM protein [Polyangiaceae bacterium]